MSVLDNLFLGRQPTRLFGFVDRARQRHEALALLEHHGVDLDLDAAVGSLPTVKQKEVEIMKALALDARVILMDEPTAWLAASEVAKLHATIRSLKARGDTEGVARCSGAPRRAAQDLLPAAPPGT
jgi:ABC-type sugar transport system ATPase subunit